MADWGEAFNSSAKAAAGGKIEEVSGVVEAPELREAELVKAGVAACNIQIAGTIGLEYVHELFKQGIR